MNKKMAWKTSELELIRTRKRRKKIFINIYIFIVIIILCLTMWYFKDNVMYTYNIFKINFSSYKNNTNYPINLYGEKPMKLQNNDNNVLLINETSMAIYSVFRGAKLFNLQRNFTNCDIKHNGKKAVIYDHIMGNVNIYDKFKNVYNELTKNCIYNIAISNNGSTAIIGGVPHYTTHVKILDKNNKKIFTWKCADNYVILGAFSSSSKEIALVGVSAKNGEFKSKVKIFEISTGKTFGECIFNDTTVYNIKYENGKFVVITDTGVYILNSKGLQEKSYMFEDENLLMFDSQHEIIALGFGKYKKGKVIKVIILNSKCEVLRKDIFESDIKSFKISENFVTFLTDEKIKLLDHNANVIKTYRCKKPIYDFLCINNDLFVVSAKSISKIAI